METATRDPVMKWAAKLVKEHAQLETVSTDPGLTGFQQWNGHMHGVTSALSFLVQAVSTDPNRRALQYMLSDSGHLVVSDGRRLHIAFDSDKLPRFANGLWECLKSTKNIVQIVHCPDMTDSFPPWRKILPDESVYAWHELHFPALTGSKENRGTILARTYHELFQFALAINTYYLEPLFCDRTWQVGIDKAEPNKKAVWFRSDNLSAIIMPMQKK